ncbi:MAG: hypothetical protein SFX18_00675 [Pirellulales bacterium]|nr:hypothetical protein [Pirellulales bacterium]
MNEKPNRTPTSEVRAVLHFGIRNGSPGSVHVLLPAIPQVSSIFNVEDNGHNSRWIVKSVEYELFQLSVGVVNNKRTASARLSIDLIPLKRRRRVTSKDLP